MCYLSQREGLSEDVKVVVRQITPQNLERFAFYATLIRRISTLYLPMDRSCLDALRDVCSRPLLPNLRFLRLGTFDEAAPDHIRPSGKVRYRDDTKKNTHQPRPTTCNQIWMNFSNLHIGVLENQINDCQPDLTRPKQQQFILVDSACL